MDITVTDLRVVATVISFATFLGIGVWAFLGRNKERFDEAAHLPFEHD